MNPGFIANVGRGQHGGPGEAHGSKPIGTCQFVPGEEFRAGEMVSHRSLSHGLSALSSPVCL